MRFITRWLSDAAGLALALAAAILLMQAPAFTREYTAALLQVAEDSGRDIDQRKASARAFYGIAAEGEESFLAELRRVEPSNAATLGQSVERNRVLRAAYERIAGAPALERPVVAALDAASDETGYKHAVLRTLAQTYAVQADFTSGAALYGIAGLLLGSLLGQALRGLLGALARPLRRPARA
jgi:hypothetical protein